MASLAMEIGDGDDYLQLPPVEEDDDGGEQFAHALLHALTSATLAGIIPRVGVSAPDDLESELATAVSEALKTVEAPTDETRDDCPICLEDDGGMAAWKETPCGHRFHGRCVERWLQAKGSCPMCRRQVVAMPTVATMAPHLVLELEHSVIFELYGQDGVDSTFMEEEEQLLG